MKNNDGTVFTAREIDEMKIGTMLDIPLQFEDGAIEILRVPYGWVFTRFFEGKLSSCYVPRRV